MKNSTFVKHKVLFQVLLSNAGVPVKVTSVKFKELHSLVKMGYIRRCKPYESHTNNIIPTEKLYKANFERSI